MLDRVKKLLALGDPKRSSFEVRFNTLLRKNPFFRREVPDVPWIKEQNLSANNEWWPLEKLVPLTTHSHRKPNPAGEEEPVIVAHYRGRCYLLDGGKRINKRRAERNEGPHPVLVVDVRAQA